MFAPLIFILKSIFITGALVLYYFIVCRNTRYHVFNRFYLLFAVIAGLVLPFVHFTVPAFSSQTGRESILTPLLDGYERGTARLSAGNVPGICIWIGILSIGMGRFVYILLPVLRIHRLGKRFPQTRYPDHIFVDSTLEDAPFSFFRYLYWQRTIPQEDPGAELIRRHELAHIRGGHSYDKLLCEGLMSFFWFNPFYRLIRRELGLVHEYIADAAAAGEGGSESLARMLLLAYGQPARPGLSLGFLQSPIRKRLLMIRGEHPSRGLIRRWLPVLPVLSFILLLLAFSPKKEQHVSPNSGEPTMKELSERKRQAELLYLQRESNHPPVHSSN